MSLDISFVQQQPVEVFSRNITHNLNVMAKEAGIYQHLWRPEELSITKAGQLVEPLTRGLQLLKRDPARFKALNPANGWGDYHGLVDFVSATLKHAAEFPDADIEISR